MIGMSATTILAVLVVLGVLLAAFIVAMSR
jgi:hypothetical protein